MFIFWVLNVLRCYYSWKSGYKCVDSTGSISYSQNRRLLTLTTWANSSTILCQLNCPDMSTCNLVLSSCRSCLEEVNQHLICICWVRLMCTNWFFDACRFPLNLLSNTYLGYLIHLSYDDHVFVESVPNRKSS